MSVRRIIAPGSTIGILGGGQLGRMTALAAARDIDLGPYTGWSEAERVVANVHALYRDFGDPAPSDALTLMGDMAALAG